MEDKQRRRSREEMFPVVEAWQQSGLSKEIILRRARDNKICISLLGQKIQR
jgi:hypothetical protein